MTTEAEAAAAGQLYGAFPAFAQTTGASVLKNIHQSRATFYIVCSVTIVISALFIATTSYAINVYNSCQNFGDAADRLSGTRMFFGFMLAFALVVFIGSIAAIVIYSYFFKGI